jgi:hypothetical protein
MLSTRTVTGQQIMLSGGYGYVKREPQSDATQSLVNGVERSSVRGRKPEFEQLGLLIETAAVENRRADRGICRWPRDRRQ